MTIDAAFAALVEANPIPDPKSYADHKLEPAAFLTATRERTVNMKTIDQQESKQKAPQRKWQPLAAVAAFVLVIAVGVAAASALRGGDDAANVPAPPFDTPQEAVEAWTAALNAGDGKAYLLLFAPDASDGALNQGGIASEKTIKDRVEMVAATETVFSVVECIAEDASQTKCVQTSHSPVASISSGTSGSEDSIVLTIDESGAIARIGVNRIDGGTFDETRFEAYDAWMETNYPELRAELNRNWASDPIDRPAADIGRESLAAAREFDAQYEG
ncbi:MAG: hypothetical protein M3092_07090 [Actinomycetia bacterium]|nr:hypothetical protein [Actinomycetes bacterium]